MTSSSLSPSTRIITDPDGQPRRQICEYTLRGGPNDVDVRVTVPRFRIGSHDGNDLVIAHPTVSRFHLEIEATPLGFVARDLGSTNGTLIDGLRIMEAVVPERARLTLGQIKLDLAMSDAQVDLPTSQAESFHGVVGRSAAMRELFAQLERVAPTNATVLLQGESGTGKERVAAAIHRASSRAGAVLSVLDCAAVPRSLIESELFGHERGAFTGATAAREGLFEEADGGTLFIDEIGELPLDLQPKLLRVLETRKIRRLGSTTTIAVDVRLVCATNRDLAREVNRGTFREDLYYRMAVIKLVMPPLRERTEDVPLLVGHFIRELLRDDPDRAETALRNISEDNWKRLGQLPWPGNVRELRNFIERTLILSDRPVDSAVLPTELEPQSQQTPHAPSVDLERPFTAQKAEVIRQFERAYLHGQLARHENNVSAAARAAGLDRMNFKRLLKKHD